MWRARDLGDANPGDPSHLAGNGWWLTGLGKGVRMAMAEFIGSLKVGG